MPEHEPEVVRANAKGDTVERVVMALAVMMFLVWVVMMGMWLYSMAFGVPAK